ARVPDVPGRIGDQDAVVLDVDGKKGHRRKQIDVPARVADGRIAEACGGRVAEDLTGRAQHGRGGADELTWLSGHLRRRPGRGCGPTHRLSGEDEQRDGQQVRGPGPSRAKHRLQGTVGRPWAVKSKPW